MIAFFLILVAGLFFPGLIIRTRSILSGRKGPVLFQPIMDLWKLFRKGSVISPVSTLIFRVAPILSMASVLMAILLIPLGDVPGVFSFKGDFVFFAYILAMGRFFAIIAALDTGSSFSGMGASREALYSLFVEPAFFILMGSFALLTGHSSFYEIFSSLNFDSYLSCMTGALAAFVLVVVAMVENSRMPVDDPVTHLELTMVHEVMILDYSGFDLGLIHAVSYLKFSLYGAIIANFFIGGLSLYVSIPLFFVTQIAFAVLVGVLESFMARFRMSHNPQFILALTSVSLLLFFGVLMVLERM